MVNILKKCGYYIGDEKGQINQKSNALDFVLFTVYFILSVRNSISSNPSNIVFILNTISIGRLILKNYIDQCKIVSKSKADNPEYVLAKITTVHFGKIIFELAALIFLLIFVWWNRCIGTAADAVTLMMLIVLTLTWLENMLCMIERLYDAQPAPLVIPQSTKS